MDRNIAKNSAEAAEAALRAVADEFGTTLTYKGGSFSDTSFTPKFEFAVEGASQVEFDRTCFAVGMRPEHFGKEFVFNHRQYQITGINLRAKKYPIKAKCLLDNKTYKFPADAVKRLAEIN